jgi:hypothetical protein
LHLVGPLIELILLTSTNICLPLSWSILAPRTMNYTWIPIYLSFWSFLFRKVACLQSKSCKWGVTYCRNLREQSYIYNCVSVGLEHSYMNSNVSVGLEHSYMNSKVSVGLEHSFMNSNVSVGLGHSYMNSNVSIGLEHSYMNSNVSVGLEVFVTNMYKLYDICLGLIFSWPPHPKGDSHLPEL